MAKSEYNDDEEITLDIEDSGEASDHAATRCSLDVLSFMQKVIAEAIGTFFVVFAGCGAVAVNKMDGSVTFPGICITWGLIITVMVYTVGHVSGAHFNPAVTVAFTVLRRFPLKQLPFYIIAQLTGAIVGSSVLYSILNPKPAHFFGTVPSGSAIQSFFLEIVISFLLMFVISGVGTDTRAIGELAGIVVGATVLLNVFIAGPISGASMNPARSLGPAIVMHNYKAIWVYIVGPTIGTILGGLTYNILRLNNTPVNEATNNVSFLKSMSRNENS